MQGADPGDITFAPGAPAQAALLQIDGFLAGDLILLKGIANLAGSHADMDCATNVLTVTEGANSNQIDFNPHESFAGDSFDLSSVGNGTEITENSTPRYCPGTLIRTPRGEVPVETLEIGGEVLTKAMRLKPCGGASPRGSIRILTT